MIDLPGLVTVALEAVAREYPHRLDQELRGDADLRPPRELHPSFYGSYDWHSAVHNHWLLVRALARGLPGPLAAAAADRLDEHLSPERTAAELTFFAGPGGRTSERPYGWAWLLLLQAECAAAGDAGDRRHRQWAEALAPLAELLGARLAGHFSAGLAFPVRSGTHGNTAFSLHLALQAARRRGDTQTAAGHEDAARRLFAAGPALPWAEPPDGNAFLTAPLTEAALMADVLGAGEFAAWLGRVLPDPGAVAWDPPQFRRQGDDPGTVHLEGLLISRAWCLDALGRALPPGHPAAGPALAAARAHVALTDTVEPAAGFGRSHWIPTFLLYLDERLGRPDGLTPRPARAVRPEWSAGERLRRRAGTGQVAVAVGLVDPAHRRPVLGPAVSAAPGRRPPPARTGASSRRLISMLAVCGAFFSGLSSASYSPEATRSISCRIAIIASQNRSSSARSSLSVGSTISVPATGNDIVGAWKP